MDIECNGHAINAQNSVRYLGLSLDNQLSGEAIVNNTQKVNARMKFLNRQCSFMEEKLRQSVCSALIQCLVDYACSSKLLPTLRPPRQKTNYFPSHFASIWSCSAF